MRVAVALALVVALTAGCSSSPTPRYTDSGVLAPPASRAATVTVAPATIEDVVIAGRPSFGVSLTDRTTANVDELAGRVGCAPRWVAFFASVAHGLDVAAIRKAPGIPFLTVEPWRSGQGRRQADYDLEDTIAGRHNAKYRTVARAVREYGRPMLLRFAHEMNGDWYPWGDVGANRPARYAEAWRHVVRLFEQERAVNAVWVWSPNVLRGTDGTPIREYYPGDETVDAVGMVGYGVHEDSPARTYGPTLAQMRALTSKPIILTETGAQPDNSKQRWIERFGPWLAANPDVIGFIWTQIPKGAKARSDWRFDDKPAHLNAFKATLKNGSVACRPM